MKDKNQQNNKPNKPKRVKAAETKIDADAKEVIRKAMISSLEEKLASTSGIKKDLNALSNVVEEFLTSFIILGYTFDGDPVHCISAHNQQEADSLGALVNKFVFNSSKDSGD